MAAEWEKGAPSASNEEEGLTARNRRHQVQLRTGANDDGAGGKAVNGE